MRTRSSPLVRCCFISHLSFTPTKAWNGLRLPLTSARTSFSIGALERIKFRTPNQISSVLKIRYAAIASSHQLFVLTGAFWVYEVFYPEGGVTFLVIVNWGSVRCRALPLKPLDTQFAQQLVNKQAATLCTDLGFNVCGIDVRGATGSLDFLGYFTKCFHAASMNHAASHSLRPSE